jgi:putative hydroxymethylpyrimidine transport system substrate-binding protein
VSPTRVVLEYFHPWTNAAGLYVASAEGWYREAGLDVEIATFDPLRGDSLAYLAGREADYAIFPSNRLLVRREQGQPLVGIAAINHRGMETIQTVRSTGITRPRELEGRTIAYNPTPRGVAMVSHLVAADGGDPGKVIAYDSGARELSVDDIAAGVVDATFGGYWAWDALFGSLPEAERVVWPVDEIGAPPYHSYLLGAHEELLERNPESVRAFLAATERGYLAAIADPEKPLALLERVIAYFSREHLAKSLSLIAPTWTHDGRWGEPRAELMEPYAAWLAEHGILRSAGTALGATTSAFLPSAVATA